jgi:hypothetical protein
LTTELRADEIDWLRSLPDSQLEDWLSDHPPEIAHEILQAVFSGEGDDSLEENYADERSARNAAVINARTAAAQEIGSIPAVAEPRRREEASRSNILFADTYFAPTFYIPWAPYQRSMMNRFESIVLEGGKECHAVRRGGLKSTCARVSTIWAVVNGHRKFPVLVGATDGKAAEHRENLFKLMASSELLLQDYPELLTLILKWKQPKKQFRFNGRLLTVHPKDSHGSIIFPDIHESVSCEAHVAPYSINSTGVSGLSYVDRFGVTIRPDLLIFDDVQTPQSAKSPLMTEEREDYVTKTFCGLAGLGEKISAIMVATVREHDDLTERFLSRSRHPDWDGAKYPSIIRMPDNMGLWESYATLLTQGATPADGKRMAQQFYVTNRAAMDEGGVVAWEEDKLPDEVSALQSLMTIRALDPAFFRCEIQQEGEMPVNTSGVRLEAKAILNRFSGIARGTLPEKSTYTVGFIDSSDQILWAMVCAFNTDFSGHIVDYRTWPDQGRPVFYKSDLVRKISDEKPGVSWEEAFVHAHNELEKELLSAFPDMNLLLKDWSDGGHMPLIRSQITASHQRSRMRPAKGFAPKPGRKPIHLWGDKLRDRSGTGWIERRTEQPNHIQFDANIIKSMAARRLLTAVGAPSAVMLPGVNERENRLLAEHFTAERPIEVTYDGSTAVRWNQIPFRDNDWWDCFCGCITAASVLGCKLNGDTPIQKKTRTFVLPGGARNA